LGEYQLLLPVDIIAPSIIILYNEQTPGLKTDTNYFKFLFGDA